MRGFLKNKSNNSLPSQDGALGWNGLAALLALALSTSFSCVNKNAGDVGFESANSGASGYPGSAAPGAICECDDDCSGSSSICFEGICMALPYSECAYDGSYGECSSGLSCWFMGDEYISICVPDCSSYTCEGYCDVDGSCMPTEYDWCYASCGLYCSEAGGDSAQFGSDLTCGEIRECTLSCATQDCLDDCYYAGSYLGQVEHDSLFGCLDYWCSGDLDDAAFSDCLDDYCWTEFEDCFS